MNSEPCRDLVTDLHESRVGYRLCKCHAMYKYNVDSVPARLTPFVWSSPIALFGGWSPKISWRDYEAMRAERRRARRERYQLRVRVRRKRRREKASDYYWEYVFSRVKGPGENP